MAERKLDIRIQAHDQASGVMGRIKQQLDSLKAVAGGRSTLKDIFEVGKGAGAVAGVALMGRFLNDATQKALELRDAMRSGKMHAGEAAMEIAKSIPVYGQFVQAGLGIHELITNEQADLADALARQTVQLKVRSDALKFQADQVGREKAYREDIARIIGGADQRAALAGLEGKEAEDAKFDFDAQGRRQAIFDKQAGELAKVDEDLKKRNAQITADGQSGKLSTGEMKAAFRQAAEDAMKARLGISGATGSALAAEDRATIRERERLEKDRGDKAFEESKRLNEEEAKRQADLAEQRLEAKKKQDEKEAKEYAQQFVDDAEESGREVGKALRELRSRREDKDFGTASTETTGGLLTGVGNSRRFQDPVLKATQDANKQRAVSNDTLNKILAALGLPVLI
jgi:hypothetical protein